jgi:hypothetical protein
VLQEFRLDVGARLLVLFSTNAEGKEGEQRNEEVPSYIGKEKEEPLPKCKKKTMIGQERRICRPIDDKFRFYNSLRLWK